MRLTAAEMARKGVDSDKKGAKDFSRLKDLSERAPRKGAVIASIAAATVLCVSCGPDGPTNDSGTPDSGVPDSGPVVDGGDGGSDGGTGSLCALYGEGHQNRTTLTLGQEVRSTDDTCQSRLVFKGISGDLANFGMYAPPNTYPLSYWDVGVGEQEQPFFHDTGWASIELCAKTSSNCDITLPVGTRTGDVTCTVTIASDKRLLP